MRHGPSVPVLRSFDEGKAREFHVDFLGFQVDWQHRFDAGAPLYMQLPRGRMRDPHLAAARERQTHFSAMT